MLSVLQGSNPQYSKGTYIPVLPTKERQSSWEGRIINKSDNVITMGITPAANCIVGKYHMYVAVMTPFGIRRTRKDNSRDVYILFNPWAAGLFSPQDQKGSYFVRTFTNKRLQTSTQPIVFRQMMLCFWMMRKKGRSVWWMRWGSSIMGPSMILLRETGTMAR